MMLSAHDQNHFAICNVTDNEMIQPMSCECHISGLNNENSIFIPKIRFAVNLSLIVILDTLFT